MKSKHLIPVFGTIVFTLCAGALMAQFPGGGTPPSGGTPACWPPPCIPIDGGVSFLLAAGIAIGGKKLLDSKK